MTKTIISTFTAEILDEDYSFNLAELCHACNTHAEFLLNLIEHGVLEPQGKMPENWQFGVVALKRSQSAVRLRNDFNMNTEAIALVLDLLDELQELRQKMQLLEK